MYCFQFSDGDNWGEDNEEAFKVLGERLLPIVNLFCYGQVESPYGSGEFLGYLQGRFGDTPRIARALGNRRQGRDLRIDQNVFGQGTLNCCSSMSRHQVDRLWIQGSSMNTNNRHVENIPRPRRPLGNSPQSARCRGGRSQLARRAIGTRIAATL